MMKMNFLVIIAVCCLCVSTADAKCWRQKQSETNKIKNQVISMLEKTNPNEWMFSSGNDIQYVKVTKSKKEIAVGITDWGVLSIDSKSVDLSDRLQARVKRLYRKITCQKVFKEVALMKELLEII